LHLQNNREKSWSFGANTLEILSSERRYDAITHSKSDHAEQLSLPLQQAAGPSGMQQATKLAAARSAAEAETSPAAHVRTVRLTTYTEHKDAASGWRRSTGSHCPQLRRPTHHAAGCDETARTASTTNTAAAASSSTDDGAQKDLRHVAPAASTGMQQ